MQYGSAPISGAAPTMSPQSAIGTGFFSAVLMEVETAVERAGVVVEKQRDRNDADG